MWDFNASEGGPIKKDKLWFFASYRDWGVYQYIANSFYKNGDQTIDDASIRSGVVRLTTQLNSKNKVSAYLDRIRKFRGHENSAPAGYAIADEATDIRAPKQYYTTEGKWTSTVSSKLLLEAGLAINNESYTLEPVPERVGRDPAPRHDSADRVRRLRRRLLLPRADPPDLRHLGVVCHRLARVQGRACSTGGAISGASAAKSADLIQLYRTGVAGAGDHPQHAAGFATRR